MTIKKTSALTEEYKDQIIKLWNSEYPKSLNHASIKDFDNYLSQLNNIQHTLYLDSNDHVVAWHIDFIRNQEQFFAIIVNAKYKGKGIGTKLLNMAKENHNKLNGWVIDHDRAILADGRKYVSPLNFYLKNGFKLHPNVRLERPTISAVKISWQK